VSNLPARWLFLLIFDHLLTLSRSRVGFTPCTPIGFCSRGYDSIRVSILLNLLSTASSLCVFSPIGPPKIPRAFGVDPSIFPLPALKFFSSSIILIFFLNILPQNRNIFHRDLFFPYPRDFALQAHFNRLLVIKSPWRHAQELSSLIGSFFSHFFNPLL